MHAKPTADAIDHYARAVREGHEAAGRYVPSSRPFMVKLWCSYLGALIPQHGFRSTEWPCA